MKLIKYENYQVLPTEEAMLVKPIRDLYNEDTSENKEFFIQQISYLYFMVDPRSTYMDILEEDERAAKIIYQEGLPKDFEPSDKLIKAMNIYKELTTTTSMKLLNSMRIAIKKIGDFVETVDLFALDDKGKAVYSVSQITSATDKIPGLAKKLIETEKIVAAEIEQVGRARGGNENKKLLEDGAIF